MVHMYMWLTCRPYRINNILMKLAIYFTLCVSAVFCPIAPKVGNATVNKKYAVYGEGVWYTCREGYIFPDGSFTKYSACTEYRVFQSIGQGCQGKEL